MRGGVVYVTDPHTYLDERKYIVRHTCLCVIRMYMHTCRDLDEGGECYG